MSELNKYPTQEVWGKKKENKPKENRKLDMKLEINELWGACTGGRSKQERMYVFIQLIYFIVWEKLTQHCKAIIFQLQKEINGLLRRKTAYLAAKSKELAL